MAYIYRANTSTATSYTFSAWIKTARTSESSTSPIFWNGATNKLAWELNDDGQIYYYSGSTTKTTAFYRDPTAWYNIVWKVNAGTGTLYINGVEAAGMTSVSSVGALASGTDIKIGNDGGASDFTGVMSHVHFCDGTAYAASSFGSTDSDTGEWIINTSPSVTYGSNGFFVLKNSSSITDQSGEGNNLTISGTLTDTQDCPDDNFSTINNLDDFYAASTFSNGNTTTSMGSSNETFNTSTLGASKGKYYAEVKPTTLSAYTMLGIISVPSAGTGDYLGEFANCYGYDSSDGDYRTGASGTSYGNTYVVNDIIGIAMDLDNNKLYFSINGVWQDSGDPESGATGTGAISITDPASTTMGCYQFGGGKRHDDTVVLSWNFGNGYFGTTIISSEGTNASGIGKFEYDVPAGYTALSTKGLNS